MQHLRTGDIIALGFMTFALFIGAGNISFLPLSLNKPVIMYG
jgi:LIVCS family branched-chain amino acid:cation transporter